MATSVNTFNFIRPSERIMYETAFNAITQLELWNFIKEFNEDSFMFSRAHEVMLIYRKIEDLGYHGHSGASFGCIMRTMKYISENSLESFEEEYKRHNR